MSSQVGVLAGLLLCSALTAGANADVPAAQVSDAPSASSGAEVTSSSEVAQAAVAKVSVFGPGEQSSYRVSYLGMTAGTTVITVGSETDQWGQRVWPIVGLARSESLFAIYPLKDKFISYWSPAKQHSIGSDFISDENRKKRRQRVKVDHANRSAQVTKQAEGESERQGTYPVEEGALDVGAAVFALRNQPLVVGQSFTLPVFTGSKSFTLAANVVGTETQETVLGSRELFRVAVATDFSGKLHAERDIHLFLTTDPSHILVKVEAELALGTVVAELTAYREGMLTALPPAATDAPLPPG